MEFIDISKNNESIIIGINIEIHKLEVENSYILEYAKKQKLIDQDNEFEIVRSMSQLLHFHLSPVAVETKEPKTVYCYVPCGQTR